MIFRVNLTATSLLLPVLIVLLHLVGLLGAGIYALALSTFVVNILGVLWRRQARNWRHARSAERRAH